MGFAERKVDGVPMNVCYNEKLESLPRNTGIVIM